MRINLYSYAFFCSYICCLQDTANVYSILFVLKFLTGVYCKMFTLTLSHIKLIFLTDLNLQPPNFLGNNMSENLLLKVILTIICSYLYIS